MQMQVVSVGFPQSDLCSPSASNGTEVHKEMSLTDKLNEIWHGLSVFCEELHLGNYWTNKALYPKHPVTV